MAQKRKRHRSSVVLLEDRRWRRPCSASYSGMEGWAEAAQTIAGTTGVKGSEMP